MPYPESSVQKDPITDGVTRIRASARQSSAMRDMKNIKPKATRTATKENLLPV